MGLVLDTGSLLAGADPPADSRIQSPGGPSTQNGEMTSETNLASEHTSTRRRLLSQALTIEYLSVGWGICSATWSVTSGLLAGSLGVLALGLSVMADIAGSAGLVWRFRVEQRHSDAAPGAETLASLVVAGGLAVVAVFLTADAIHALATGSGPGQSVSAMVSAGAAAIVLTPLGVAKHRVGTALHSHALKGDGTLSAIGAALGLLALLGLLANRLLGWWWVDRGAALAAAAIAAAESVRVLRNRPRSSGTP